MDDHEPFEPFRINEWYYLLIDGSNQPIQVPGDEVLAAMAVGLPASYWPVSDGPGLENATPRP